jgi:hypothetical protein
MNIQLFDFSVNLLNAMLWQYNEAENLLSLVTQKQAWYDTNQTQFWQDWYTNVFNLDTANEFGLIVWSLILDIPLFPDSPTDVGKNIWGFGTSWYNFENGNFSYGIDPFSLTLEEKRLLLKLKYFKLTSRCAIPEINAFLAVLFNGLGPVYVLDTLLMKIIVIYDFQINLNLARCIRKFDLIPRGSGVGIEYRILPGDNWGFDIYQKNFENGGFAQEF